MTITNLARGVFDFLLNKNKEVETDPVITSPGDGMAYVLVLEAKF